MCGWTLPPELDDMILDHLHDDPAALAQCALVCRSWLPTARYHTWSNLRLTCSDKELARLGRMLEGSPGVARHVRNVVLTQRKGDVCQWYDLHLLHTALTTLSRFPSLAAVTLDGLWFGASKMEEVQACQVTFPSVRRLCVSSCTFDSFDDVEQLCGAFPALARLQFDGVWWGRWVPEQNFVRGTVQDAPGRAIALKELDLGSCFSRDKVIDWLLTALPEASVETLRLPLVGAYDTRLRDLLAFIGPSLQHLELGSPSTSTVRTHIISAGTDQPLATYLDMSHNTGLRSLQLGVPTYRDPAFISLWLAAVLAQVHSRALAELRFAVYPILRGDAADAARMLDAFDWAAVVRVLRRPQFAALRRVAFVSGRATDYAKIPDAFVALQPVLAKVVPSAFEPLVQSGVQLGFQCL